jgi:ribosomal protein S18 acetylase RimI-like enzyme
VWTDPDHPGLPDHRGQSLRLDELNAAAFGTGLGALVEVYAEAMRVSPAQLPGRRAIMASHAGYPAFRAFVVTLLRGNGAETGPIVAFAYGFRGARGQWWHDMVRSALTAAQGSAAADDWLADSFEVAELHVHPRYQRQGIGRWLLCHLTGRRAERTAVLSTMDTESPARRLYRSLGFRDLLIDYRFSGADAPYAVMGATLPLRCARPPSPRY